MDHTDDLPTADDIPEDFHILDVETLRRLERNDPDVDSIWIFGSDWIEGSGRAIGNSTGLRELKIHDVGASASWRDELGLGLSHNRSIENLVLIIEETHDERTEIFQIIAPFLEHNKNLRSVDIQYYSKNLDSIVTAFTCANNQLRHFHLTYVDEDKDEDHVENEIASLIESLTRQNELLELSFDNKIGKLGITALGNFLKNSELKIQSLELRHHELGNGGAAILGSALAINKTLKKLVLKDDATIDLAGWQGFLNFLQYPSSTLEKLHLSDCFLNFDCIREVLMALSHNRHLKVLEFSWSYQLGLLMIVFLRQKILHCLSNVVCDVTSIESTYSSNHTLCCVRVAGSTYESSYLTMNENENKASVARQKILKHHFTESNHHDDDFFTQMQEAILPHAISWIGRDSLGYSLMLNFVRGNPTLFHPPNVCHPHAGVKRKQC